MEVHWWPRVRCSLWKPCFKEDGERYQEAIPKENIVQWFKWKEAQSGTMATMSRTLKTSLVEKYNEFSHQ